MKLSDIQKEPHKDILSVLEEWSDPVDGWDAYWLGYNSLFDQLNCKYSIGDIKGAMKQLKSLNKVEQRPTYGIDDYKLNGSGWFINENYENEIS